MPVADDITTATDSTGEGANGTTHTVPLLPPTTDDRHQSPRVACVDMDMTAWTISLSVNRLPEPRMTGRFLNNFSRKRPGSGSGSIQAHPRVVLS